MSKNCGLYKTTLPIPSGDEPIAPPRLVYYHNHSKQGPSMVLLPEANESNKWSFPDKGFLVSDPEFIGSLVAMKAEGLYRVSEHFHPDDEHVVAKDALVQLGYNGLGEALIFFPARIDGKNAIEFPKSGMKVTEKIYDLLEPLDTAGPQKPNQDHVH